MSASDEDVNGMFWRLVERFGLEDAQSISDFFSSASDSDISGYLSAVHAKRISWSVRFGGASMSEFQTRELLVDLAAIVDVVDSQSPKFAALCEHEESGSRLCDAGTALYTAKNRVGLVLGRLVELVEGGRSLADSHYAGEVSQIAADVRSTALPLDQAVLQAMRARDSAEEVEGDEHGFDDGHVLDLVNGLVEKLSLLAVVLEMIVTTSSGEAMVLAAAPTPVPDHFPGQTNMPKGRTQKSPYKRLDWVTVEDYNKGRVDYSKTDDQYVSGNVPKDSQLAVGGDPGNPIYVP